MSLFVTGMNQSQFHASCGRKDITLPVLALASYKFRGSILTPTEASELHKMDSLVKVAADWLQNLQVKHLDYEFFHTLRTK